MRDTESEHKAWHGSPTPEPRYVDDGGRVTHAADPGPPAAPDRDTQALTRELGALVLAVVAVLITLWALRGLGGWPELGLVAAAALGCGARALGYTTPR